MILIDGIFLNSLGGKSLLKQLINHIELCNISAYYIIDTRSKCEFLHIQQSRIKYVNASILKRHKFYKKHDLEKVHSFSTHSYVCSN